MATGALAGSVARDIAEFDRLRVASDFRHLVAAWRNLPAPCQWVEYRGGAFAVASMAGVFNDEDNTFTPADSRDRLPVWWKSSMMSMKVYERAPGPQHCGVDEDYSDPGFDNPPALCGCDHLTCMGNCGE